MTRGDELTPAERMTAQMKLARLRKTALAATAAYRALVIPAGTGEDKESVQGTTRPEDSTRPLS